MKVFLTLLSVTLCTSVMAENKTDMEKYLTIETVEVEEVNTPYTYNVDFVDYVNTEKDQELIVLDQIVNYGKKAWAFITKNKPVVNLSIDHANALPQGITDRGQLNNWHTPKSKAYKITYKNLYGITVISFTYRVLYTAGGTYDGKGQYLTRITALPADLYVAWGFKFNATTEIASVLNTGTAADPVAGAEVQVHWNVSTIMTHSESTQNFFVKGDGEFVNLN